MVETKQEKRFIKLVYEDDFIKLEKDSQQWIVTYKDNGNPKYYTYLPNLLNDLSIHKIEDKIIKKGLLKVINEIKDIKRTILQEINVIMDKIGKEI